MEKSRTPGASQRLSHSGIIAIVADDAGGTEILASYARTWGAEVPFMRPQELSDDHEGTTPVIAHATRRAMDQEFNAEAVCRIYATTPFVQINDLIRGWEALNSGDWDYKFTVTDFASPIFRSFKPTGEGVVDMSFPEHFATRSQDCPVAYHDAGQFYWGRPAAWLEGRRIFDRHSAPIVIPRWQVQDIDTQDDWKRAEIIYDQLESNQNVKDE